MRNVYIDLIKNIFAAEFGYNFTINWYRQNLMGGSFSSEPTDETISQMQDFVTNRLHFSKTNIFTKVEDILDAAQRMYTETDPDEIKQALLILVEKKFIRFSIQEDEPQPDIILNHCLMDIESCQPSNT